MIRPPHSLHRQLNLRLSAEETELLDVAVDRFGTIRAAVVAGLTAIDRDGLDVDQAEVHAERGLYRDQLETLRTAHAGLRARAEGRLVDHLYCHVCETWVSVDDCAAVELPEGGYEIFHEMHGHRSGHRFRADTGIARRDEIVLAPAE